MLAITYSSSQASPLGLGYGGSDSSVKWVEEYLPSGLHLQWKKGLEAISQLAQKCMSKANEEIDQNEKINYLIAGLSSYNKYLKRNFDLQFVESKVISNIICSSSEKSKMVDTIEKSFSDTSDDKLKPTDWLSIYANQPKEQFLIEKQLSTKIIETSTFIGGIISVAVAVIRLALPE